MKKVRVIARLDVKGPNVVKGVQFEALRVMGKPSVLAREYFLQGADELLYLDIVASLYRRDNLLHIVREASKSIFIPFIAGGGVRSVEDIYDLLQAGAEKVAINTAATKRPELITEAAQRFGSQCIVVSIEAKKNDNGGWEAFTDNGRQATGLDAVTWAKQVEKLGAGEILLTSVDQEGTERGLDTKLIAAVTSAVSIPVIASGGAASAEEVAADIAGSGADAVAVASMLHYGKTSIGSLKDALIGKKIEVRRPTASERAYVPKIKEEADMFDYNRFTRQQIKDTVSIDPAAGEAVATVSTSPRDADVTVIDYGINNVRSVVMAFESVNKTVAVATTSQEVANARRLVLPGVGAFGDGMQALHERGLDAALKAKAKAGTPILGICLGMQLLFSESEEFGTHKGLGLINGRVVSFPDPKKVSLPGYKLPHIGWGELRPGNGAWRHTILGSTEAGESVYFVHSFYPVPEDPTIVLAYNSYGGVDFCAAIKQHIISATQFHPEKSGATGLRMLAAFCEKAAL
ncbi:MAG: imidazole glycerol phosphate synthase subunit HisH [Minisyncoccia bacterium]|jgi:imidazole glycerol phosphate synthase glutamine amidotransferase subunit